MLYNFVWHPLSMKLSCFLLNFTPWKGEQKQNIVLKIFLHNTSKCLDEVIYFFIKVQDLLFYQET